MREVRSIQFHGGRSRSRSVDSESVVGERVPGICAERIFHSDQTRLVDKEEEGFGRDRGAKELSGIATNWVVPFLPIFVGPIIGEIGSWESEEKSNQGETKIKENKREGKLACLSSLSLCLARNMTYNELQRLLLHRLLICAWCNRSWQARKRVKQVEQVPAPTSRYCGLHPSYPRTPAKKLVHKRVLAT